MKVSTRCNDVWEGVSDRHAWAVANNSETGARLVISWFNKSEWRFQLDELLGNNAGVVGIQKKGGEEIVERDGVVSTAVEGEAVVKGEGAITRFLKNMKGKVKLDLPKDVFPYDGPKKKMGLVS